MGREREFSGVPERTEIVLVLTKLELGGAQKVCLSLFRDLNHNGRPAVLISGAEGLLVDKAKAIGSTVLLPELKRELNWIGLLGEFKTFFVIANEIRRLLKKNPGLIVHTHSSKAGILGRWAAWVVGCRKIVHTIHGYPFNEFQPWFTWLIYYSLEYLTSLITTRFICVSRRDELYGRRIFPKFSSELIRAAVSIDEFTRSTQRTRLPDDPLIIVSIGCFKPQKNLLDLLRAFKAVHEQLPAGRPVLLEILGDGEMRPVLEDWICKHGLGRLIRLSGWCSDVAIKLSEWDLFAMSSLWEGLPCAVIEARLSRLPVVAYDVGGISEVISNGQNGFVVEPGNWLALSMRLRQLILNDQLRHSCAIWPDKLDEFSNEAMCKKHRSLYDRL